MGTEEQRPVDLIGLVPAGYFKGLDPRFCLIDTGLSFVVRVTGVRIGSVVSTRYGWDPSPETPIYLGRVRQLSPLFNRIHEACEWLELEYIKEKL